MGVVVLVAILLVLWLVLLEKVWRGFKTTSVRVGILFPVKLA